MDIRPAKPDPLNGSVTGWILVDPISYGSVVGWAQTRPAQPMDSPSYMNLSEITVMCVHFDIAPLGRFALDVETVYYIYIYIHIYIIYGFTCKFFVIKAINIL